MKTLTIEQTARILNKNPQLIRLGLQQDKFSFGTAIKNKKEYSYVIYKKKLEEYIGEIKEWKKRWNINFAD